MLAIVIMNLFCCSAAINGARAQAVTNPISSRAWMSSFATAGSYYCNNSSVFKFHIHRPRVRVIAPNHISNIDKRTNASNTSTRRRANAGARVAEGTTSSESESGHEPTTTKQKTRKQRKRVIDDMNLQRIDKVLAHRGVGSRSETFELAKAKRITWANSSNAPHSERVRIRGPKEKVPFEAALFIDGNLLPGPPPLLLVYHKPKYVLSAMEDDKYQRNHLGNVLEERYKKAGIHPVGRLDYDTTGLLLFSLDGKLTQQLLHPRRGVEKEYVATVQGQVDEDILAKKLWDGVETAEGRHTAKLLDVSSSEGPTDDCTKQVAEEADPEDEGRLHADYSGPYSDVRLVVREGKYRMVRRMLANCGYPVVELRRLRHGKVELGGLKAGEFRQATEEEIQWAKTLIDS